MATWINQHHLQAFNRSLLMHRKMFVSHIIYWVLSATLVTSSSPRATDIIMASQITTFVNELALPSPQAKPLVSTLVNDSNLAAYLSQSQYVESGLVSLACYVAQIALGATSVDQTPVNATEIEVNW